MNMKKHWLKEINPLSSNVLKKIVLNDKICVE